MIVKVIGKYMQNGVGKKSGKPYTCVKAIVSRPIERDGGAGVFAEEVSLFGKNFDDVKLGAEYAMEYNRKGFVDYFVPASK